MQCWPRKMEFCLRLKTGFISTRCNTREQTSPLKRSIWKTSSTSSILIHFCQVGASPKHNWKHSKTNMHLLSVLQREGKNLMQCHTRKEMLGNDWGQKEKDVSIKESRTDWAQSNYSHIFHNQENMLAQSKRDKHRHLKQWDMYSLFGEWTPCTVCQYKEIVSFKSSFKLQKH